MPAHRSQAAFEGSKRYLLPLTILLCVFSSSTVSGQVVSQDFGLPPGRGLLLIKSHCIACHDASRIAKGGGTDKGWADRISRMIRFGSTIPRNQVKPLAAYLAKIYPPKSQPIDTTGEEQHSASVQDSRPHKH
jgi:hypothetical protein